MANFQPQLPTSAPTASSSRGGGGGSPEAAIAQGVVGVANTIGNLFVNKANKDQAARVAAQKLKDDKTITDFSNNLLTQADMLRTTSGADSSKVQSSIINSLTDITRANPHLNKRLLETYKQSVTTEGMGAVISGGTAEEKVIEANNKSANDAGWHSGIPDHEKDQATEDYMQMKKATSQLEFEAKQYTAQVNKDTLETKEIKTRAQEAVADVVKYKAPDINRKLTQIVNDFKSGKITADEAEAVINEQEILIQSLTTKQGELLDPTYMTNITKPLNTIFVNARNSLSGQGSLTAQQNQNKTVIEIQKTKLLKDPKVASLVAGSEMLGHSQSPLIALYSEQLLKGHLFEAEDPNDDQDIPQPFSKDKTVANATYDILLDNMTAFNDTSRSIGPDQFESMTKSVERLLEGVSVYQMSVQNPSDYNEITDFIADPRFGKWAKEQGGLDPSMTAIASEVIKREYSDRVIPLLKQELLNATFKPVGDPSAPEVPMTSIASIKSQGGRVTFSIDPAMLSKMVPLDRRIALREVENLRATVAPVLNKMIRTGAHLNNQDYETFFQENYAETFGISTESDSKSTSTPKATPSTKTAVSTQEQAAKDAGVDLSSLADGQYQDGSGQVITIKDGKIVE